MDVGLLLWVLWPGPAQAGTIELPPGTSHVVCAAFSPDGSRLSLDTVSERSPFDVVVAEWTTGAAQSVLPRDVHRLSPSSRSERCAGWTPSGALRFRGMRSEVRVRLEREDDEWSGVLRRRRYRHVEIQAYEWVPGMTLAAPVGDPGLRVGRSILSLESGGLWVRSAATGKVRRHVPEVGAVAACGSSVWVERDGDLWTADLRTGALAPVDRGPEEVFRPTCAGDTVAWFARGPHDEVDLIVWAGATRTAHRGVRLPLAGAPALSPSGDRVAWRTDDPGDRAVHVASADGASHEAIPIAKGYPHALALGARDGRVLLAYVVHRYGDDTGPILHVVELAE